MRVLRTDKFSAKVGTVSLCWGYWIIEPSTEEPAFQLVNTPEHPDPTLDFRAPFTEDPTVIITLSTEGAGHAYVLYGYQVGSKGFVNLTAKTSDDAPPSASDVITVSYVALPGRQPPVP